MEKIESGHVHCGVFDSERFWRGDNLALLPGITDRAAESIIENLDELFFLFCNENDILLTKRGFNKVLRQYLEEIGHEFESIHFSEDSMNVDNIFRNGTISDQNSKEITGFALSPFAVVPNMDTFAYKYGLIFNAATLKSVQRVNSKLFSNEVIQKLNLTNYGVVINSPEKMEKYGNELLADGSILVKDIYGVSGKGNLAIRSSKVWDRVVNYYKQQVVVQKKEIALIIEPLLDKCKDFSCQFFIQQDGSFRICSVQILENDGFSYKRSISADKRFMEFLEKKKYFDVMAACGKILFENNYHGDVCVDSMILKSGEIVPIVEINARKSMSLLKHYLDKMLAVHGASGDFKHMSFVSTERITIDMLLAHLSKEGILFMGTYGIMPLCSNALEVNYRESNSGYKGRLYYSSIAKKNEAFDDKLKEIMTNLGAKKIM